MEALKNLTKHISAYGVFLGSFCGLSSTIYLWVIDLLKLYPIIFFFIIKWQESSKREDKSYIIVILPLGLAFSKQISIASVKDFYSCWMHQLY